MVGDQLRFGSPPTSGFAAAVWDDRQRCVANGFSTRFRMSDAVQLDGGFTFSIQNSLDGTATIGSAGNSLGIRDQGNVVSVAFESFPPSMHVTVTRPGSTTPENRGDQPVPILIPDGRPHDFRIDYEPGAIRVVIDGLWTLGPFAVDIEKEMFLSDGKAFVGLTAGAAMADSFFFHDWEFQPAGAGAPHSRRPGSVLVFPIHRSGPGWFTILSVTNTATTPIGAGTLGGTTNAHFEYANVTPNPANPFRPFGCTLFDRVETLTPADTVSVLTHCHNAVAPFGQEGFVVVTAEDPAQPQGGAWNHNYLIGSELVLNATGVTYSVNAYAAQALVADPLANSNSVRFDGVRYTALPDHLYVDSFVALAESSLTLVNLTGAPNTVNSLYLSVWNDNESPLSGTLDFSCWFDQPLTAVSPLFAESFLLSTNHDPRELDITCDGIGDLETGWAMIESVAVRNPDGSTVAADGAVLGTITSGRRPGIDGGHLLWESEKRQGNGEF
ncbi:MAG: hypothetical protein KDB80_07830, partial [Planctomycetes bacterium]|nr:hypothetical protein [Planctomycetota bacterium]